ncbi:MAG: polysaccharide biosynthesis/export family protein [Burkholderiales bacterium]|nr:polysaccharide biosynthesis/export family protein [Burkholderiales bacterium]
MPIVQSPTKVSVSAYARTAALALAAFILAGCTFSPGLYFTDTAQSGEQGLATCRVGDTPPPGALIDITPELIQHQRDTRSTDVGADIRRLFGVAKPYQIGPGDILNIVVWDHPELSIQPASASIGTDVVGMSLVGNGYPVSPEGLVQFPYAGSLKLGGLTDFEARDLLVERLSKYLKDPQVTVRVQTFRSGRVYVDGEVARPGLQAITDLPATLPDIINRAGGFTAAADRSTVTVSRNGSTTVLNVPQLTALGVNPSDILLGSGDLVRVPHRDESKVYVIGEVLRPTSQPLRNGRLTLNEALGEAGGVNPNSANPSQIYVVRSKHGNQPEIYHLDASTPVAYALAEGFELKSRDVVYVDPVPLVRWNRVISLILPSAGALTSASTISNNLQ